MLEFELFCCCCCCCCMIIWFIWFRAGDEQDEVRWSFLMAWCALSFENIWLAVCRCGMSLTLCVKRHEGWSARPVCCRISLLASSFMFTFASIWSAFDWALPYWPILGWNGGVCLLREIICCCCLCSSMVCSCRAARRMLGGIGWSDDWPLERKPFV